MSTTAKESKPPRPSGPVRWKLVRAGGLELVKAPALGQLDWLVHGFSTRQGGISELGEAKVLNLGFTDWDSHERVVANRNRFFQAIGADTMHVVTLKQSHSDRSCLIDRSSCQSNMPPEGDALFTREPGILLTVQTADCIPILLADTGQRAVAAIHAGWRGTLRRIAPKTLGRMRMEFGTRPEDVTAALGPGIGRCCYQVGSEVACEFAGQFPEAEKWFDGPFEALTSGASDPGWLPWLTMRPPGHPPAPPSANLDLIAANRAMLLEAGVPARQISASGFCTACRHDIFFSYRREHQTGRLLGAIGLC